MRITRLGLPRYGHLTDLVLDFPIDRGLHVVLGVNEAGKSTALEAMADGLFGFGKGSIAYQHPDDPRVVLGLQGMDGHAATFERRKTGRSRLLDGLGAPVLESDLARFTGGMTRDRFREMFGLTGERLRRGGDTILKEQGDAGLAMLQDGSGLGGLRAAMKRLEDAASALFIGHGNSKKPINVAAKSVGDLRRLMDQRALSGTEYAKAQKAREQLDNELGETHRGLDSLQTRQRQLERIRRTMNARGTLAEAEQERAALGAPPLLPPDAAAQRIEYIIKLSEAERDRTREAQSLSAKQIERDAIIIDSAVLDANHLITWLHDDLSRFVTTRGDRSVRQGEADASLRNLNATATQLGIPDRGAELLARIPTLPHRNEVGRLQTEHALLTGGRESAEERLLEDRQALTECQRALASLAAPPDVDAMRATVDAVRNEGAIDRDYDTARSTSDRADQTLSRSLAALRLWSGTAAELAAAQIPLDGEVANLESALKTADQSLVDAQREMDANADDQANNRAALIGSEAAGLLPTASAVATLRARRDTAWRLLRRRHIDGGAAASDDEREAAGLEPDLPAALDRLLIEADSLADRRITEVEQVTKAQTLRSEEARLTEWHLALSAKLKVARNDHASALAAWNAAWSHSGIVPLLPAAMRDWIKDRAAVLVHLQAAETAQQNCNRLAQQRDNALQRLRSAASVPGEIPNVAQCLLLAESSLKAADGARDAIKDARKDLGNAERRVRKAEQTLDGTDIKIAAWREAWAAAVAPIGLTPDVGIEHASEAIGLWGMIDEHSRAWAVALDRIKEMDGLIDYHQATRRTLAAQLGEVDSEALSAHLMRRLRTALGAQQDRGRLDKDIDGLQGLITKHEVEKQEAERALQRLRDTAGAQDDAGLLEAIERAKRHGELVALTMAEIAELARNGDGKTRNELDQEAAGIEPDSISGELDRIEADISALQNRLSDLGGQLSANATKIKAMEAGQDVTGPAQQVQDHLVEIDENANRYVRLRLAHALLQGGVETYRREQQGPLLTRAAVVFTMLTEGRYTALEAEIDKSGQPTIIATRSNSTQRHANELSEGTRDQLFLALRLASIEMEAQTTELLPLIADDLLVNFDNRRALAALRVLADFGRTTQIILFTHHAHIAAMIDPATASLHYLPAVSAA